jgi:deoxyribodipyrimidine photo-lyase
VSAWRASGLDRYDERHDDLAGAATSKLSAYLHFGCVSPLELATDLAARPGGEPFVRQLCWRDFFYQVAAAHPQAIWANLRPGALPWQPPEPSRAQEYLDAWRRGETGYPIVDAAMRQLLEEGFVHNRARLVAASFLAKDLGLPWWDGARHYLAQLVDADVVVNNLNWQWVAGTGNDTNRYRVFNPTRQAERFDPDAAYIKRYLPQFAALPAKAARDPDPQTRRALGYPSPIVSSASSRR